MEGGVGTEIRDEIPDGRRGPRPTVQYLPPPPWAAALATRFAVTTGFKGGRRGGARGNSTGLR